MFADKAGSHANDYRSGIRSAIRGLWRGAIDRAQFEDVMARVIRRGLGFAFAEGAAQNGIKPDEYSGAEVLALQDAIDSENQHVTGLAVDVEAGSKVNGGKLEPLFARSELWIARYEDLVIRAKTLTGGDKKLKWVLGRTEKHCGSCSKLNGKVKRASWWSENGILPRVPGAEYLECQGYRCDCNLEETTEPLSRGAMPRLP